MFFLFDFYRQKFSLQNKKKIIQILNVVVLLPLSPSFSLDNNFLKN